MNTPIQKLHAERKSRKYTIQSGTRYGHWIILGIFDKSEHGNIMCWCRCDCGSERKVSFQHLRRGESEQCVTCGHKATTRHGHASGAGNSPTYSAWHSMIQRCTNVNHDSYSRYGGRGIKVCDRWNDFSAFLSDMGEKPKGLTLERKDNAKGYEPRNCKWATVREQAENKRTTRFVFLDDKMMCMTRAAEAAGIHINTLRWHLFRGKSVIKNGKTIRLSL